MTTATKTAPAAKSKQESKSRHKSATPTGPHPIDRMTKEEQEAHMKRVCDGYQAPGRWDAIRVMALAEGLESAVSALLEEHPVSCDCLFCEDQAERDSIYRVDWREKMVAMAVTSRCIREAIATDSDGGVSARYASN